MKHGIPVDSRAPLTVITRIIRVTYSLFPLRRNAPRLRREQKAYVFCTRAKQYRQTVAPSPQRIAHLRVIVELQIDSIKRIIARVVQASMHDAFCDAERLHHRCARPAQVMTFPLATRDCERIGCPCAAFGRCILRALPVMDRPAGRMNTDVRKFALLRRKHIFAACVAFRHAGAHDLLRCKLCKNEIGQMNRDRRVRLRAFLWNCPRPCLEVEIGPARQERFADACSSRKHHPYR